MVDGGVFPERTHFINDRNTQQPPHAQGWNGVEHGRMGMKDVRADHPRDLEQPGLGLAHQRKLREHRELRPASRGGAVEVPAVDRLFRGRGRGVLGAGEVKRFPTELALLAQDRQRAKRVAAVQGNRVVEHMENAQRHQDTNDSVADSVLAGASSTTLRRKASNITRVHSGAL